MDIDVIKKYVGLGCDCKVVLEKVYDFLPPPISICRDMDGNVTSVVYRLQDYHVEDLYKHLAPKPKKK